jgi:predicted transcriptional regulator
VPALNETTFTFRVDETLKSKFTDAAKARDRTGAQLLRDFMRGVVSQQQDAAEYDAWFRHEVEAALAETSDPATRWVSNEQATRQSREWRRRVQAGIESGG